MQSNATSHTHTQSTGWGVDGIAGSPAAYAEAVGAGCRPPAGGGPSGPEGRHAGCFKHIGGQLVCPAGHTQLLPPQLAAGRSTPVSKVRRGSAALSELPVSPKAALPLRLRLFCLNGSVPLQPPPSPPPHTASSFGSVALAHTDEGGVRKRLPWTLKSLAALIHIRPFLFKSKRHSEGQLRTSAVNSGASQLESPGTTSILGVMNTSALFLSVCHCCWKVTQDYSWCRALHLCTG